MPKINVPITVILPAGNVASAMYSHLLRRCAAYIMQRDAWRDAAIESSREVARLRSRLIHIESAWYANSDELREFAKHTLKGAR